MASVAVLLVILSLLHSSWEQQAEQNLCKPDTWECPGDSDISDGSGIGTEQLSYAFALSSEEYGDGMSDQISLKIYHRTCPTLSSTSPSWYKLEAISEATGMPVGEFDEPFVRWEAVSCHESKTIIFKTCHPHPLDLPKTYSWTAPNSNAGEICFRLTVKDRDSGCHMIEKCIQYNGSDTEYEMGESGMELIFSAPIPTAKTISNRTADQCRRNCSNAKPLYFCGSDGQQYTSRCEKRQQECITGERIHIENRGDCPTPTPPPVPECIKLFTILSSTDLPWKPACNCEGNYKLIQCDETSSGIECWCSREMQPEVGGTRSQLQCLSNDPSQLDFFCTK